jgi:hypothetical protein
MIKVKKIEVIYNDEDTRGEGTQEDVVRRIIKLYTPDGKLIMVNDPTRNPQWEINEDVLEEVLKV